jgi:tRNA(His) guanylyltransferase
MAASRFAYVRNFELPDPLLPATFILLRIDGHSFHRFSDIHTFAKPNDSRALQLMDHAARSLMDEYPDIILGFGESDEYRYLSLYFTQSPVIDRELAFSFVNPPLCTTDADQRSRLCCAPFSRPHTSCIGQITFPTRLCTILLRSMPVSYSIQGREKFVTTSPGVRPIVCLPSKFQLSVIHYPSAHINNLYNTAFWALVQQGGQTTTEAHETLRVCSPSLGGRCADRTFLLGYCVQSET